MISEPEPVEEFASSLLALAKNESVRAIEALASALANRRAAGHNDWLSIADSCLPGFCEAGPVWGASEGAAAVCLRVARRALSGSLRDPTQGATAFHHIDTTPDWARERFPIAVYGPYLFYRV